jgi:hypothetical protein
MSAMALRILDLGLGVFPLRPRTKEPACRSWDDYVCSRVQAGLLRQYGVALTEWIGVADTDTPDAEAWASAHLPFTPFVVRTARGFHRYYRIIGRQATFIHRDAHKLEFRNKGQYVVGPGSVHPSGHIYTVADWSWRLDDLPVFPTDFIFDDRDRHAAVRAERADGAPYEFPAVVKEPGRHDELFRLLRQCKGRGWDKETTRDVVAMANQNRCQPPLREDATFEQWFDRAWANPDRPLVAAALGLLDLRGLRGL